MRLKHLTPEGELRTRETLYEPLGLDELMIEWKLSLDTTYGLNRGISVSELSFIREDRAWLYSIFMSEGPVAMVHAEIFDTWWILDFSTVEITDEFFRAQFQSPSIDLTAQCEIRPDTQYTPAVRAEEMSAVLETFSNHDCSYYRGDQTSSLDALTVSMPDAMAYSCTEDKLGEIALRPSMDSFQDTYTNFIADPTGTYSGIRGFNMVLYSYLEKWDTDHGTPGLHTDGWNPYVGGPIPKVDAMDGLFSYEVTSGAEVRNASFSVSCNAKVQIKPGTITTRHWKCFIVLFGIRTIERGRFDNQEHTEEITNEVLDASIYGISPIVNMSTSVRNLNFNSSFVSNTIDIYNRYAYETVSARYSHYVKSMQKWIVAMPIVISEDATWNPRTFMDFTFEASYTVSTDMRKTLKGFWGESLYDVVNRVIPFSCPPELADTVIGDMSLKKGSEPVKVALGEILNALSAVGYGFIEKSGNENSIQCLNLRDMLLYPRSMTPIRPEVMSRVSITSDEAASVIRTGQDTAPFTSQTFSERELTLSGARTPEIVRDIQQNTGVETNGSKIYSWLYTDADQSQPFLVDMGNSGSSASTYLVLNGRWTNARVARRLAPLETGVWSMASEYTWKGSPRSEVTADIDGLIVNEGASVPSDDKCFAPGIYNLTLPLRDAAPLFSDLRAIEYNGESYLPVSISAGREPQQADIEAKRYSSRTYRVTPVYSDHAVITPSTEQSVEEMSDITFTIHADPGYQLEWLLIDDEAIAPAGTTDTQYTFSNVTADHTIGVKTKALSNLYFEAEEDEVQVWVEDHNHPDYELEYRINSGDWTAYEDNQRILLNRDDQVYFRGTYTFSDPLNYISFSSDKPVYCYGSVMSIAYTQDTTINREWQFYKLFSGMTGLLSAPALPAVKLQPYCYAYMFSGCSSLKETPAIETDYIEDHACTGMFMDCSSLTESRSVTQNLAPYALCNCYNGCTNLKKANDITSQGITSHSCEAMFANCGSLETPPALPSNLADYCYTGMFSSSSLTTAPAMPALTLAPGCYQQMLSYTWISESPELPAPSVNVNSYRELFTGDTVIHKITCLAVDVPSGTTDNWVDGVPATGEFFKSPSMSKWETGVNGVPSGWIVRDKA